MGRLSALLLLVLTVLAFGSRPAPLEARAADTIAWKPCGQIECATFDVPLDYTKPGGATISLSLIRIKARDQSQRLGVLMANPGGPGASANEFVRIWRLLLSNDVRNRFDIVSFDPRGVGESSPVVCHDNLQALVAVDPDPDTDAEWQEAREESKRFADACAAKYSGILPHLGTKNVARDMDRIRAALGEEKLNYVGYSYGTGIGAVYADMFPTRIRAMVLDGGMDLSLGFEDVSRTQMVGFERALEAYLADCRAKSCALAKSGDPLVAVKAIIAKAEEKPIPADSADRPAGPGEVLTAIFSALYSQQTWGSLTRALTAAQSGDGAALVRLADDYLQRDGDGDYPNLIEANAAVNYVDYTCPKDPEAYRALGDRFAVAAPLFGRSAATSGLTCAYWQAQPDPLSAPRAAGAPPIVVISTTIDPATPYEWGKALGEQLDSGVLVTHRGQGHTIYAQGNSCIDDVVNAYLLNLAVPPAGTSCGNGPPPPESEATPATPAAPASPAARATSTPGPGAPRPPATGDAELDDGSLRVGLWALGASALALAVAGAVAVVAARRR